MTYSKIQHDEARQEASNLITQALQILQDANNNAIASRLWVCNILETGDTVRTISVLTKYLLPPPTETR